MGTNISTLDVLEELESYGTNRTLKLECLKKHSKDAWLSKMLKRTYDWTISYGIGATKGLTPRTGVGSTWEEFDSILTDLEARKITGQVAKDVLRTFFAKCNEQEQKWYTRVLDRDLQIRISSSTVNKIWPKLIPTFDLQLAEEVDLTELTFPIFAEPKYDGMRILFFVTPEGKVTACSRGAKTYDHLEFIGKQLFETYGSGIFDGEMLAKNWGETITFVKTKPESQSTEMKERIKSELYFYLFDRLPYSVDMPKSYDVPYDERIKTLYSTGTKDPNIQKIIPTLIHNHDELEAFYQLQLEQGFEGVMLKDPKAFYEASRNRNWQKLKPVQTRDGVIISVLEGTSPNTIGKMGRMRVRFEDGVETFVGTGFTFEDREKYWKMKDALIGQWCEIKDQADVTKVAVARFPVFVRMRPDKV